MEIYSIGFTQKSAAEFFGALKRAKIRRLMDIRLNNTSQLSGFTKAADLPYLLKEICKASYVHEPMLAPTKELMDGVKKEKGSWDGFEWRFLKLMREREVETRLDRKGFADATVLLCSEPTAEHCHRRLVLEYLAERWGDVTIRHL
jgi:uncharacterized protein (DUF488 family)